MPLPTLFTPDPRSLPFAPHLAWLGCALLAGATPACAQEGGAARALTITPTASIAETLTNNVLLTDADRRSDAVTVITAGISAAANRGRVRGSVDYQLTGSIHARETGTNNTANALRASVQADVIENFLLIDASASISQQLISPFGKQSVDPTGANDNRTEVRSIAVSPSIQSRLGGLANLSARASHSQTSSASTSAGDLATDSVSASLTSASATAIGWSATLSHQSSDYDVGRRTTTDLANVGLSYRPDPDLMLTASGGRERSNLTSLTTSENHGTWGVGLTWTPSERTRLVLQRDSRFFGDTHSLSFEHRMARSNWRFSSSRDLSTGTPAAGSSSLLTLYDLLFANRAAQIPDPALRRQAVLDEIRLSGKSPTDLVASGGFVSSAVTLVSRQDLSVALQGVRTTLTLGLYRSDSRRIDAGGATTDGLGASGQVRQQGFNFTVGHRLTPSSDLNLGLSQGRTRGGTGFDSSELRSLTVAWTSQLGARTNLSLGARHVSFDSTTSPYVESALTATIGIRL